MKHLLLYCLIFLFAYAESICVVHTITPKTKNSISEIISNSNSGDTILIKTGYYKSRKILIDKPITIIGESNTIIDAENTAELFIVKADNVSIIGLNLKNIVYNSLKDNSAILIENASNIKLKNNKIENSFFAIYIKRSENIELHNNTIKGNSVKEALSGNAIHIWYCTNVRADQNNLSGHRDGIYIEFSKNCLITNNNSHNNLRYGLHFMFSDSCDYERNTFNHNGAGVAVMYSKYISMTYNNFSLNRGTASYGLLLKDISNSAINRNVFTSNTVGIYAEGTNRCTISENDFRNNAWALRFLSNCFDNTLSFNNFYTNTFEFATNKGTFRNKMENNYWSSAKIFDLNRDGISDIPHRPMTLFAYLVENYSETLILNRSFFIKILNLSETLLPSITPKDIVDDRPLMAPHKYDKNR
ncbi:MAG: nitrous oxide reductase family maturation protein NosD [Ignavibacteriae bacterium HGW-Ignavibacteriae-1]|jgi:nitrous oxidase accessory protein|nr:MAG: nitrous oxide reductase family maturation protein NosD [Ignavibacteriae bacterium HGW-Ignavibacteriae-1]